MSDANAELPPSLAVFFKEYAPYLFEGRDLDAALAPLGTSPSPATRFDVYRQLIRAAPRHVIRAVYKAAARYLEDARPGAFGELVELHLERRPAKNTTDYPGMALGFDETVAAARERDPTLPPQLEELVDFELHRHRVQVFPDEGEPIPGRLHPSVELRSYTFHVPEACRAVRRGAPIDATPGDRAFVLHRHPETARHAWFVPSMPQLVAVAIASGEADRAAAADAGLGEDDLLAAEAQLVERGVLVGR